MRIKKAAPGLTITAVTAGGLSASATLTITSATEEQWLVGNERFNNGKSALPSPESFEDSEALDARLAEAARAMMPPEAGLFNKDGSCASCHGEIVVDPERGSIWPVTIRNTPTQIGGYTDAEIKTIITTGAKPRGTDSSAEIFGSRVAWKYVHRWEATPEQLDGLVVYLRSLPPREQESEQDQVVRPGDRGGRKPPPDEYIPPDEFPEDVPPEEELPDDSLDDASVPDAADVSDAGPR